MTILFAGGGSLGPVTPLIAVSRVLRRMMPGVVFAWAGTPDGPERGFAEAEGMEFSSVPVAKWPRYPSVRWATFPWDAYRATRIAYRLIGKIRPDAVVSVGGFTAVPVIRAASAKGIPCFIHQLDKTPTLSNRLVAKKCASVTTSFVYERPPFGPRTRTVRIPTPTGFLPVDAPSREQAILLFGFDASRPVTLVTGGGQGATALNAAVFAKLDAWIKETQVIHVCGRGKVGEAKPSVGYLPCELLDVESMRRAYAASDLVVTRGGMGALSEIASLSKASVIVPIPESHQEVNAQAFVDAGAAVLVAQDQPNFADLLFQSTSELLKDAGRRDTLGRAAHEFLPTDDGTSLASLIAQIVKPSKLQ